MKKISLFLCSLLSAILPLAHCSLLFAQTDSTETVRFNTIKYGTETEIATLIQALKTEGADYLDNEIIALVENTRNQKILSGAFAFFGEREKGGLEDRAVRAIDERDVEESETVLSAIDYLGKVKAGAAASSLQDILDNEERRFMGAAFRALGQVSVASSGGTSDDTAEYLIDYYENRDPGDGNRRDIITAVGATGSAAGVPFLAGLATDNEERAPLRMAALEALGKIGHADGLNAVIECVSSNDPNVRSTAVTALGPFSGDAVDKAILDAFRDSYYRTRIAAAQASRQRKLVAAVPYLQFRAERDDVPAVKEESIRALGAIANAEAMNVIRSLFTGRTNADRVRIVAGETLMQNEPERNLDSFFTEMDEARQKNQTALYNGFLRTIGTVKSAGMEPYARRLIQNRGATEKFTAMDMAANNNLTGLAAEIRTLAEDRSESLARKARRTLEILGLQGIQEK
jgi:HEAT repeat protein